MVAQCNLDQWEVIEKKLHPEAELLCSLHFGALHPEMRILQAIFKATPFYNSDTGETSFTLDSVLSSMLFLKPERAQGYF